MANEIVKNKSLSDGMVFNAPEMPSERGQYGWDKFKQLFIGRIGTMVILNLLTLLFALPAVADLVIFTMTKSLAISYVPYSANVGIGYPVVVDAIWRGQAVTFYNHLIEFAILIPALAILFIGLGGNMYAMRNLLWNESKKPAKEFFIGIKKSWWQSILTGLFVGAAVFAFVISLSVFDFYKLHIAYKIVGIIAASLVLVAVALYSAFFMAQSTSFSMRFADVAKNSVLLSVNSHVIGVFFVIVAIVPILLTLISSMLMLVMLFYIMLGFSYTSLVITLYCHSRFEACLYYKASNTTAVYAKHEEKTDDDSSDKPKKQAANTYKNPKKRKKTQ